MGNAQEDFDVSSPTRVDGVWSWTDDVRVSTVSQGGKLMRVYRLAMCLGVIGLTMSLGYSTSEAQALPSLAVQ